MKFLKHILVVVALLATLLPCGHAAMHHDHHHDEVGMCEIATEPCCCHSCEHTPCADTVEIQLDRTPGATTIEQPLTLMLLFVLPETKPALKQVPPPVPGVLATLQTVQLLI